MYKYNIIIITNFIYNFICYDFIIIVVLFDTLVF